MRDGVGDDQNERWQSAKKTIIRLLLLVYAVKNDISFEESSASSSLKQNDKHDILFTFINIPVVIISQIII